MSAGTGYRYLLQSVAVGDADRPASTALTRYYTEVGSPAGRWLGAGLADVDGGRGLAAGSIVTEEQLFRLLGMATDPVSGDLLGAAPRRARPAGRGATDRGDKEAKSRPLSQAVAGFDLTMSVPKSVSAVWAVADARTQELIVAAHHASIADTLAWAERHVLATRTGRGGAVQVGVRGVLAACFDHYDSRANDPHLHTHVVIANRVQAADGTPGKASKGKWRTLDSRALFRAVVALSELHQGLLMDRLTAALGVGWDGRTRRRSPVPQWEITGVPDTLRTEFSRRSGDIEVEKDRLVADYTAAHGRAPSPATLLKLRQQATLATRPDKHTYSLAELADQWRTRARAHVGADTAAWVRELPGRARRATEQSGLDDLTVQRLAEQTLATVAEKRATFTRWNVYAEAQRQLHGTRLTSPHQRFALGERVTDLALQQAMLLTAPDELQPDQVMARVVPGWAHTSRYTTAALFDAEERLLETGRSLDAPTLPVPGHEPAAAAADGSQSARLSLEQRAAIAQIATSGRSLDVLVGAAGTGKTATMAGLAATWQAHFGPGSVIGLAPSAAAAEVLGDELRLPAENTARWLAQHDMEPARRARLDELVTTLSRLPRHSPAAQRVETAARALAHEIDTWRLRPGHLVILDEASLAGTRTLDRIAGQARAAGAKVLLVGDWAQLAAVDAGGAFAMLAHDRPDVVELLDVHRFTQDWEKTASLQLRAGDPAVIDTYLAHDRVHDDDREMMLEAAYTAWLTDQQAGRRSLLLAVDTETVTDLNRRARDDLIDAGLVCADGVPLADGTLAGVGDRIVTRHNDRHTTARDDTGGTRWVKNGDEWTVLAKSADGSLTVQLDDGTGVTTLTADYVSEHVELAYATTAHRAQGRTVDTAHALITSPSTTREALYVLLTRGRDNNHAYLATDQVIDPDTAHGPDDVQHDPRDLLTTMLENVGAEPSAHEVLRRARHKMSDTSYQPTQPKMPTKTTLGLEVEFESPISPER